MKDKKHFGIAITCILIGGILGGLYNAQKISGTFENVTFHIIAGIIGASLVPLILRLLLSDLLKSKDLFNYLIFFGFTLLASIYANKIIEQEGILDKAGLKFEDKKDRSYKLALLDYMNIEEHISGLEDKSLKSIIEKNHVIPSIAKSKYIDSLQWKEEVEMLLNNKVNGVSYIEENGHIIEILD
ncbi:hypothetical protein N9B82_01945 [Saprospiraceae bacterium]|nr:hypothetical protein [Saprospiraceae bacterium]